MQKVENPFQNATLHIEVDKVSLSKLNKYSWDSFTIEGESIDANLTTINTQYSSPVYIRVKLYRNVNSDDISKHKGKMPGFKLKWWYTVTPGYKYWDQGYHYAVYSDHYYEDSKLSQEFRR